VKGRDFTMIRVILFVAKVLITSAAARRAATEATH
jgi:hypothetical protein